jgi:peroxiredoxin
MKLKTNDQAIGFKTFDISGNKIDLEALRGKKVFLSFYRGASCPFCNIRVHEIIGQMDHFQDKGSVVIGFFTSGKQEIMEFAGKQMDKQLIN